MSATQATLYGALIAGVFTLLGVVAGLLAQHWLRRRGEVRIHVDAWTWWGSDLDTPYEPKTGSEAGNFDIHVFNDRDVNISLWNVRVDFYRRREHLISLPALDAEDPQRGAGAIDLESRKSVFRRLLLWTGGSEGERKVKSADRVEFTAAIIPKGEGLAHLPFWDDIDER